MSVNASVDLADSRSKFISHAIGWCSISIKNALGSFIDYLHNLPSSYPNYLTAPEPEKRHLPFHPLLLLGLVFLCLIPRALVALRIGSICPDAVLYIRLAEALKVENFHEAFASMRLNVFPIILMLLNQLGLSWETCGPFWNVMISSLVVLPLYGFARRQFDDTVALVSCMLYAVHPIMITFFTGSLLAGIAGILTGTYFSVVRFDIGLMGGIKGFSAAGVGGLGNFNGAILGGLTLGVVETFASAYIPGGTPYKDVFAFVIVIFFLVFKPSGLLGEKVYEKV